MDNTDRVTGWWIFAAILLSIAGVLNIIWGIAAIAESNFTTVAGAHYVFSDLKTWGWIVTCIGVLQCIVALGIWARAPWARWTGVFIASLNAIAQLSFLPAYPWMTLAIFTLDILVIYGLVAHGGRSAA